MKKWILGLDLGITSVGFAVIDKETLDIKDYGVRLFDEFTADKNLDRRTARGQRRLKSRRNNRKIELKRLINKEIISKEDFEIISSVYELREKGLTQELTPNELANVILHFAKKRGSSLEVLVDESDEEGQKMLKNLSSNTKKLQQENLYICQLQLKRLKEEGKIKGFLNVFKTEDYLKELKQILSNQNLSEEVKEKILFIVSRRRRFSEGPGDENSPTPYGRFKGEIDENGNKIIYNLIELMRGKCSVYPDELRAAKNTFSAELFNLLNDLNNITIFRNDEKQKISKEEKLKIIEIVKRNGNITIKQILKILNVGAENVSGFREDKKKNPIITKFEVYAKFVKIANNMDNEDILCIDFVDKAIEILTKSIVYDERAKEIASLANELGILLKKDTLDAICKLVKVNGYHSLSKKAIDEINAEMLEEPVNQQQIISNNKRQFAEKSASKKIQFDDSSILSPVAKRVQREAIRVLNELIKEYGNFDSIVIETTRSKNSKELKDDIAKQQANFEQIKTESNKIAQEYNYEPQELSDKQKLKLRLYKEQEGKCIYSGKPIDLNILLSDPFAYQIEHIIPYSISFDNSLRNKALSEKTANDKKGNMTPYQYFKSGKAYGEFKSFEDYKVWVLSLNISRDKKNNLLSEEDFSKFENMESFVNRNLVDTSYAIRSFMRTLNAHFKSNNIPTIVRTIKGKQTSTFRRMYQIDIGIEKDRDYFIHHAIDALIIAGLGTNKEFQKAFSQESTENVDDNPLSNSQLAVFAKKIREINQNYSKKTNLKLFSYKIDTKIGRELSDATIYSTRNIDGADIVVKKYKDIYNSKDDKLTKIFSEGKQSKLLMYRNDPQTFAVFQKIYDEYSHVLSSNVKNVFAYYNQVTGEKIRKYSKKGNGAIVENVKLLDSEISCSIDISHNYNTKDKKVVLLKTKAFRIDIYKSETGGYKFLTIRRHHLKDRGEFKEIPLEIYNQQKEINNIDENYKFQFSLYRNNVFMIKTAKNTEILRFIAISSEKSSIIECKEIAVTTEKRKIISISKNTLEMKKYNVSPIGKWKEVVQEELKLKF